MRKAATSAVKKSKKSSEEFGRRLESNYFSSNKVFWKTICRLRGKRLSVTYSIKDSVGNILTDENEILSRCREYFEDLLNLVKVSTHDTQEVIRLEEKEYGVDGQSLRGIKSFYCRPEVCVRVNGKQLKPFHVGVGLRQGCALSPLLFIVCMNWIDKCRQADECAPIGNCKISRLLFGDDLVLLSSSESGLQRASHIFANACDTAGIKISSVKTEVLHLSRNSDQYVLQVNGATLKLVEKFRYL